LLPACGLGTAKSVPDWFSYHFNFPIAERTAAAQIARRYKLLQLLGLPHDGRGNYAF
jgi:hypothetical protein